MFTPYQKIMVRHGKHGTQFAVVMCNSVRADNLWVWKLRAASETWTSAIRIHKDAVVSPRWATEHKYYERAQSALQRGFPRG